MRNGIQNMRSSHASLSTPPPDTGDTSTPETAGACASEIDATKNPHAEASSLADMKDPGGRVPDRNIVLPVPPARNKRLALA